MIHMRKDKGLLTEAEYYHLNIPTLGEPLKVA
jgi:hypothetical protein